MHGAKRLFRGTRIATAWLGLLWFCAVSGCGRSLGTIRPDILADVWKRGLLQVARGAAAEAPEVTEGSGRTAVVHHRRGQMLFRQGHFYEAVWELKSAIKAAPGWAVPREHLGLLYETIGRSERAIIHYSAALTLEPHRRSARRRLARCCVNTGGCEQYVGALLEQIACGADDARWREWAERQLAWRRRS